MGTDVNTPEQKAGISLKKLGSAVNKTEKRSQVRLLVYVA